MGSSHASSGILVGAATLPHAPIPPTPGAQAAWVVAVGGMAMLPDLDHHSSTVAHMWGAPSRAVAAGVGACAGGHRNGTHSILGVAALTLLAWMADDWGGVWGRGTVIALAIGVALYACTPVIPDTVKIGRKKIRVEESVLAANLLISALGAWWLVTNTPAAATAWLPYAVAAGMLTHIAGDWLTKGGVPLLWPIPWRTALGLFTTGGRLEKVVVAPGFAAAAVLVLNHNGLLGVPTLVGWIGQALDAMPAFDDQVTQWGAPALAAAILAGVAAFLVAKDTRAWGMVTA